MFYHKIFTVTVNVLFLLLSVDVIIQNSCVRRTEIIFSSCLCQQLKHVICFIVFTATFDVVLHSPHSHCSKQAIILYACFHHPPSQLYLVHMQSIQTSFNMVLQVFIIPIKALYLIQYIKMYAKLIVCHTKIHHLWYKHVILTLRRLVTTKYVALKFSNLTPLTQFFCHSLMWEKQLTQKSWLEATGYILIRHSLKLISTLWVDTMGWTFWRSHDVMTNLLW